MINYIKKLFFKPEPPKTSGNNKFSFILNPAGEIKLELHIHDDSEEGAKDLGIFLCYLNEGLYAKDIVDTIETMTPQDEDSKKFTKTTILSWHNCLGKMIESSASIDDKEDPIISPTNFSRPLNK